MLYLFCCRGCSTFKLLRAQLPEDNKYYRPAPLPDDEDEDEDEEEDGIVSIHHARYTLTLTPLHPHHSIRADCRVPPSVAVHSVRMQCSSHVLTMQTRAVLLQDAPAPRLERRTRGRVYVLSTRPLTAVLHHTGKELAAGKDKHVVRRRLNAVFLEYELVTEPEPEKPAAPQRRYVLIW